MQLLETHLSTAAKIVTGKKVWLLVASDPE